MGCFSTDGTMWTHPKYEDPTTRIYSVKDSTELAVLQNGAESQAVRFSQDDRTVAVALKDRIILWHRARMPGATGWLTLPAVWFAVFCLGLLVLSYVRDPKVYALTQTPPPLSATSHAV